MRYTDTALLLRERLSLDLPPVALALVEEPPAGVPCLEEQAPSACSLWRRAESDLFYASAEAHMNCPIGAMVMGFELPEARRQELMDLAQQMCSISYIQPEEVPHIPKFERTAPGIVYGPLARFPLEPDVVILWTTPMQAMLFQESVGGACWSETPQSAVFGRPACGALPAALARGKATISLGCMGMRTYTEIPEDRCLMALPGSLLSGLDDRLERTLSANEHMKEFYLSQKVRS